MASGKRASSSARHSRRLTGGGVVPAYNGGVHEQLSEIQRGRILAGMFALAAERGASNVSVAHVVERSGVSRRTFYELFSDREDCLRAAFEQALSYAAGRVLPAYEAENGWRERIRAALLALLGFLDEEPLVGRLLIVESHAGGPVMRERRAQVLAALTGAIERGREQAKAGTLIPSVTGEGILGGVLAVVRSRLVEEGREPLVELTNPLMGMIVLPYLGAAAARRELERPLPVQGNPPRGAALLSDPFKGAGMRLTYRTVRVLMAIAELEAWDGGPSNRVIADTAEIKDQGQISKLLGRLERIGMIGNAGLAPGQGGSNAWRLTSSGRQVLNSIRTHTEDFGPALRQREEAF
jgi:AcrR family transcriptional regulator